MKKLFMVFMLVALLAGTVFTGCQQTGKEQEEVDETRSQIYVGNPSDNGIGGEWLQSAKEKFEAKYAETRFEPDKMGVQVILVNVKDQVNFATTNYDVFFLENVRLFTEASQGNLLDISDIVTESLSSITNGAETGTIEDKLTPTNKKNLAAIGGKYYGLPHYETYEGLSFDRDVFEDYGLFFLEGGGFCDKDSFDEGEYIGEGTISVGPDGERGTLDDGLPSSYEEFKLLLDEMVRKEVVPFIWTGQHEVGYVSKLVNAFWAAYSGFDEMRLCLDFDSNATTPATKSRTVTGFNGTEPIIREDTITPENGYNVVSQAGKYYGLKMLELILSNSAYHSDLISETLSHIGAQEEYILSNLEQNPIAMLIDGSYWVNEAKDAFERSEKDYGRKAQNRRFSYMPLPNQVSGQVTEGNGKKTTLVADLNSFAVIPSKVAKDSVKLEIAKKFLQFCYTDEMLVDFTRVAGVFRGVNYEIPENVYNELNAYAQGIVDLRKKADVVSTYSKSDLYVNHQSLFDFTAGGMWFNGQKTGYTSPFTALDSGVTAEEFFLDTAMDNAAWLRTFPELA